MTREHETTARAKRRPKAVWASSELFLARCRKANVQVVELANAGHYPLEQPGIDQLHDAIDQFLTHAATDRFATQAATTRQ